MRFEHIHKTVAMVYLSNDNAFGNRPYYGSTIIFLMTSLQLAASIEHDGEHYAVASLLLARFASRSSPVDASARRFPSSFFVTSSLAARLASLS